MTLVEQLERNAARVPEKPALVHRDGRLNWRELDGLTNRVANSMAALGVKKGDVTALVLERVPELIVAFLASVKLGAVPAPVNYNLRKEHVQGLISFLKPPVVFTASKFLGLFEGTRTGPRTVVCGEGPAGEYRWEELAGGPACPPPGTKIVAGDVAYLNYTSGTTGEQKGALATHENIYWNTRSAVEVFGITGSDVHLCVFSSFSHPHELFARALYTGGAMVLINEVFPKSLLKTIREQEVTCMMGLTPMYELLLDVAGGAGGSDLGALRLQESGGMYTTPDLVKRFEEKFGVPVYPVWGSTETTGIALATRPAEAARASSIGRPCPYYDVKVVDEAGGEVMPGEVGELLFKGPAVVSGYWGLEEDRGSFRDGWYLSGDLGRRDEDGYFYFVDRKSAMMKVAGLKVYPMEIEKTLMLHPGIREAAVVSSVDGLRGEVPRAVISPKEGASLTKAEVAGFLRTRLAGYKVPRIIEFREELPKSGSGKIDKKALA